MPADTAASRADAPIPARPIEFDTARLRLRQWRASDFAPFAAMNGDPRVMEFFPELLREHESHATARHIRRLITRRGWGLWAVEVRGGPNFIGFVGFHEPAVVLPFSPCIEIGWRLAPDCWGQGFATEAARGALDVAFGMLGLDEIVSFAAAGNRRSLAVMERLGMRRDPEPFDHPGLPVASPLRRHLLYRIRSTDWLTANAKAAEADSC